MQQEKKRDWLFGVIGLLLVIYVSSRYMIPSEHLNLYYLGGGIFGILFLGRFFYKRKKKERARPYLIFVAIIGIWLCLMIIK